MTASIFGIPWSEEALFAKARLYAEIMESHTVDDWQFGLWSTFVLEMSARAALAHISAALLADKENWRNITYSLGEKPTAKKFTPVSISAREVVSRLQELTEHVTPDIVGFCNQHFVRRNTGLHSGELVFSDLGTSKWLPNFYQALNAMVTAMNRELGSIVTDSRNAQSMIDALQDEAAKAVAKDINAYSQVWSDKSDEDKETAIAQAKAWAIRYIGHRVSCPACASPGVLHGTASGAVSTNVDSGEIVQRQTMFPTAFECIACGLKILGLAKLSTCGLGDAFTATTTYTPAEYFELYTEEELQEAVAEAQEPIYDDFNE